MLTSRRCPRRTSQLGMKPKINNALTQPIPAAIQASVWCDPSYGNQEPRQRKGDLQHIVEAVEIVLAQVVQRVDEGTSYD